MPDDDEDDDKEWNISKAGCNIPAFSAYISPYRYAWSITEARLHSVSMNIFFMLFSLSLSFSVFFPLPL